MRFLLLALPLTLAGCFGPEAPPPANPPIEEVPVNESASMDVNVNAMAACVRKNATSIEAEMLDEGGQMAQTATRAILQRPTTGDCIVAAGVNLETVG